MGAGLVEALNDDEVVVEVGVPAVHEVPDQVVVAGGFDAHEELEFVLFVVLLYLLDFAGVLQLALAQLLLEGVLEGQAELNVLGRDGDC